MIVIYIVCLIGDMNEFYSVIFIMYEINIILDVEYFFYFLLIILQERKMVIYVEEFVVWDFLVCKDEKFICVRLNMCIFKEGKLLCLFL